MRLCTACKALSNVSLIKIRNDINKILKERSDKMLVSNKGIFIKVGFDIGGVCNKSPLLFAVLSNLLVNNGHEVHIITGQEETNELKEQLKKMCIKYTHFFSITDYQRKLGTTITYDENGTPWMDEEIWNKTKGEYCFSG